MNTPKLWTLICARRLPPIFGGSFPLSRTRIAYMNRVREAEDLTKQVGRGKAFLQKKLRKNNFGNVLDTDVGTWHTVCVEETP